MILIGVDYHPSIQTIAFLVEVTGECSEQELHPSYGQAEEFYQDLQQPGLQRAIRDGGDGLFTSARSTLPAQRVGATPSSRLIRPYFRQRTDRSGCSQLALARVVFCLNQHSRTTLA
jgi:hypothetical protein